MLEKTKKHVSELAEKDEDMSLWEELKFLCMVALLEFAGKMDSELIASIGGMKAFR